MGRRSDEEPRERPRRARRRRRKQPALEERIESVLSDVGLPQLGEAVTDVIGRAASEIDRSAARIARQSGPKKKRRRPRRRSSSGPRRAHGELRILWDLVRLSIGGDGSGHIGLVWGLLWIRREAGGGWDFRLLWGLLRMQAGLSDAPARETEPELDEPLALPEPRQRLVLPERSAQARELQNLSASIAHEIRNPITAAKSLVQQMGEDPRADDNVEYAKVALEELARVERSVSHLLRFAREENGEPEAFELAEAVRGALPSLTEAATERGVEIDCEMDSDGSLVGDPEQMRRVVVNLVNNAVDALVESRTAHAKVSIQMGDNLAGTDVWLRVRDNGPGIAPEDQERIFAPFHTSKEQGTGLGLAITRKLVETHGGTIELESALGKGTEFLLTFPKRTDAA